MLPPIVRAVDEAAVNSCCPGDEDDWVFGRTHEQEQREGQMRED